MKGLSECPADNPSAGTLFDQENLVDPNKSKFNKNLSGKGAFCNGASNHSRGEDESRKSHKSNASLQQHSAILTGISSANAAVDIKNEKQDHVVPSHSHQQSRLTAKPEMNECNKAISHKVLTSATLEREKSMSPIQADLLADLIPSKSFSPIDQVRYFLLESAVPSQPLDGGENEDIFPFHDHVTFDTHFHHRPAARKRTTDPNLSKPKRSNSELSSVNHIQDEKNRRISSRLKDIQERDPDQSLVFPGLILPSALIYSIPKDPKLIKAQISEFFNGPVCGYFHGDGDMNYASHCAGMFMEYRLRKLVGANVDGSFADIVGYNNVLNPWSKALQEARSQSAKRKARCPGISSRKKKRRKREDWNSDMSSDELESSDVESCDENYEGEYQSFRHLRPKKSGRSEPYRLCKPWGKRAKEMEDQWVGPPQLMSLYERKRFVSAGLHFDSAKEVTDVSRPFQFSLPDFYGEYLINTEVDFEVPYDIMRFYELCGGIDKMKQLIAGPTTFVKIKSNIFVDRKPRKPRDGIVCQCAEAKELEVWDLNEDNTEFVKVKKHVGCGENCINRYMYYECDPRYCPSGENCSNQRFQKRQEVRSLEVCHSDGCGFGLRTKTFIPKGSLVCEYRGEIISQDTCVERMNTLYKDLENYYFLEYASGEVIDGCRKGTEARFVNHSCDPNCHIEKWCVNGEFSIGLFSSRDIDPGTELTYDYRFQSFGPMQRCMCGSDNCRGFIGVNKKTEKEVKETSNANTSKTPVVKASRKSLSSKNSKSSKDANDEAEKQDPVISTNLMIPTRIVYISAQSARAHFKSLFREMMNIRQLIARSKLLLVRNLKRTLLVDIADMGGFTREELDHVSKSWYISPELKQRRQRGLKCVLSELTAPQNDVFNEDMQLNEGEGNVSDSGPDYSFHEGHVP